MNSAYTYPFYHNMGNFVGKRGSHDHNDDKKVISEKHGRTSRHKDGRCHGMQERNEFVQIDNGQEGAGRTLSSASDLYGK